MPYNNRTIEQTATSNKATAGRHHEHRSEVARSARAVAYLRTATREEISETGEPAAILVQRDACQEQAARLNAKITAEFIDVGKSGRNTNRPGLQTLLSYIRAHQVDYVIVQQIDRLSRNPVDGLEITAAIGEADATLMSCSESIDNSPSGALIRSLVHALLESHFADGNKEPQAGLQRRVEAGRAIGRTPLGYRRSYKCRGGRLVSRLELDPKRAPALWLAFRAYASGDYTLKSLRRELARRGLSTPQGRTLTKTDLRRVLANPAYKGMVSFGGRSYPGEHQPLVPAAVWERVQIALARENHAAQQGCP